LKKLYVRDLLKITKTMLASWIPDFENFDEGELSVRSSLSDCDRIFERIFHPTLPRSTPTKSGGLDHLFERIFHPDEHMVGEKEVMTVVANEEAQKLVAGEPLAEAEIGRNMDSQNPAAKVHAEAVYEKEEEEQKKI